MSLVDLKQVAKEHRPRIKQYYIKSRLELIQILSMPVLPESFRIEKLTIAELRKEAKVKGISSNIWNLRKAELVELLYPGPQQNNKDYDSGKKHDDPEKSECKDVGV
jgi:hypothetical protein